MSLLEKKLLEKAVVDDATFRKASIITKKYGGTLMLNLVRINAIIEDDLLSFITEKFSIESVTMERLSEVKISILNIIPSELAKRFRLIPFGTNQQEVKLVMSDPTDRKIIDEVAYITGRKVQVFAALESVISWALLKYYGVLTESGSELVDTESASDARGGQESEEIPIPLVTRKKKDEAGPRTQKKGGEGKGREEAEKAPPAEEKEVPEMGGWDAPFELSRTSTIEIDFVPGKKEEAGQEKRYRRKTPTKVAIPAPGEEATRQAVEAEAQEKPVVLEHAVEEEAPKAGARAEPESPKAAPESPKAAPAAPKKDKPKEPVQDRDSSVSIAPVFIIGSTSTVAETIKQEMAAPKKVPSVPIKRRPSPVARQRTLPPGVMKGVSPRSIDPSRVDRWAAFMNTLTDTEKIIERTLSFLDTVFGPAIFMRRKKDILEPYRFSLSIPKSMHPKLVRLAARKPAFEQIWECLESGSFSLAQVSSSGEYKGILEINVDAGWEDRSLVLIIPVIIGGVQAGVLVAVPAREWEVSQELQDIFKVIEQTLSGVFEKIIRERKKGGHGK